MDVYNLVSSITDSSVPAFLKSLVNGADAEKAYADFLEQEVQFRTKLNVGDKVTDEQLKSEEWVALFSAAARQQDRKALACACQVSGHGSNMEILVRIVDWKKVLALVPESVVMDVYNSVSSITDAGAPAYLKSLVNGADAEKACAGFLEQKVHFRTKLSAGDKVTSEQSKTEEWDAHISAAARQQDPKALAYACQINGHGSKMEILVRTVDRYKVFALVPKSTVMDVYNSVSSITDPGTPAYLKSLVNGAYAEKAYVGFLDEKLVCKPASSEIVEKEAIVKVCKHIKELFPMVKMQPDCKNKNQNKNKNKHSFLASPSPKDTVKLVCKLASSFKDVVKKNQVASAGPSSSVLSGDKIGEAAKKLSDASYPFLRKVDWLSDLYVKPLLGTTAQQVIKAVDKTISMSSAIDGILLKAAAEAHHKAIGSINDNGLTSAADYEAVNAALERIIASELTSNTMDVYKAWAGLLNGNVPSKLFSAVNTLDANAAAKTFYEFKGVLEASVLHRLPLRAGDLQMYWRQLVLWCSQPSTANSEAIYSCRPFTFISVSGFLFNDSDTSISWLSSRTSPQALVTALLVRILRVYIFEQLRHILPTFWSNHCLSYFPLPLPQFGHLPNYVGASWPCYAGDHDSHFYSEADDDEIQMSLEFHGIGNIPANTINPTHLRPFRCSPSCGADKVDEACIGHWCRDDSDEFRVHSAFPILLGLDTTTLRFLNRNLYLGPICSHPSLQAKAGTEIFWELSFHQPSFVSGNRGQIINDMAYSERCTAKHKIFPRTSQ